MVESHVTLGRFLFERLKQLNVKTVFGLPGDFNMSLLDKIYEVDGMKWAGNTNELNAAYAADGYAKVNRLGCLVTTFGVGELSAINGLAGSYAEHVGIVHIVGVPSISSQAKHLLLHHTLGNGDFTVFHRMLANLSVYSSFIKDVKTAAQEVDTAIRMAYMYCKPVYLAVPVNMVNVMIPTSLLRTPLDLAPKPNEPWAQEEVLANIFALLEHSKNPIFIVDSCVIRHQVNDLVCQLINKTNYPFLVTAMGKGAVNEQNEKFAGIFLGNLSDGKVSELIKTSDLVLSMGSLSNNFQTGAFQFNLGFLKHTNIIEFHHDSVKIRNLTYPGVQMKFILECMLEKLPPSGLSRDITPIVPHAPFQLTQYDQVTQEYLWKAVGDWLQEGDIIITEAGTSTFGILSTRFPKNCIGINQAMWGAAGYSIGACLGALFATMDTDTSRRVLLFVGDGSLQISVQEFSTIIRWGMKPFIFVVNNSGYGMERYMAGNKAVTYNDVPTWNHLKLLPFFGCKDYFAIKVETISELDDYLKRPDDDKINLVEVILDSYDIPGFMAV